MAIAEVLHRAPYLKATFASPMEVLSWAIVGGARRRASSVIWREVRNADLPTTLDPLTWFQDDLRAHFGEHDAVGLLTSRALCAYEDVRRSADGIAVRCVATVGLGNALRAGDPTVCESYLGTINVLCAVSVPLSEEAMVETMALVTEAKTLAVREAALPSIVSGYPASGTGTDCCVVAAEIPGATPAHVYAGKHTLIGHLVGDAVHAAIAAGCEAWKREQRSA